LTASSKGSSSAANRNSSQYTYTTAASQSPYANSFSSYSYTGTDGKESTSTNQTVASSPSTGSGTMSNITTSSMEITDTSIQSDSYEGQQYNNSSSSYYSYKPSSSYDAEASLPESYIDPNTKTSFTLTASTSNNSSEVSLPARYTATDNSSSWITYEYSYSVTDYDSNADEGYSASGPNSSLGAGKSSDSETISDYSESGRPTLTSDTPSDASNYSYYSVPDSYDAAMPDTEAGKVSDGLSQSPDITNSTGSWITYAYSYSTSVSDDASPSDGNSISATKEPSNTSRMSSSSLSASYLEPTNEFSAQSDKRPEGTSSPTSWQSLSSVGYTAVTNGDSASITFVSIPEESVAAEDTSGSLRNNNYGSVNSKSYSQSLSGYGYPPGVTKTGSISQTLVSIPEEPLGFEQVQPSEQVGSTGWTSYTSGASQIGTSSTASVQETAAPPSTTGRTSIKPSYPIPAQPEGSSSSYYISVPEESLELFQSNYANILGPEEQGFVASPGTDPWGSMTSSFKGNTWRESYGLEPQRRRRKRSASNKDSKQITVPNSGKTLLNSLLLYVYVHDVKTSVTLRNSLKMLKNSKSVG
jgi:hypothetical protein